MHNQKDTFFRAPSPTFCSWVWHAMWHCSPPQPHHLQLCRCPLAFRTGDPGQTAQERWGRGGVRAGFHPNQNSFKSLSCVFLTESQLFTLVWGYDFTWNVKYLLRDTRIRSVHWFHGVKPPEGDSVRPARARSTSLPGELQLSSVPPAGDGGLYRKYPKGPLALGCPPHSPHHSPKDHSGGPFYYLPSLSGTKESTLASFPSFSPFLVKNAGFRVLYSS